MHENWLLWWFLSKNQYYIIFNWYQNTKLICLLFTQSLLIAFCEIFTSSKRFNKNQLQKNKQAKDKPVYNDCWIIELGDTISK